MPEQKVAETVTKEKPKPAQCQSCGICIGPGFIETLTYQVGKFRICGWCRIKLTERGHVELDGRRAVKGEGTVCHWLYPNGSVKPMRVVTTKYPEPEVLFLPFDRPLPEDLLCEDSEENSDNQQDQG